MGDSADGFAALRAALFRLYHLGQFEDALTLLEREGAPIDAPAEAAMVVYWRACLLTVLGRADAALHALEAGLARGYWWSEVRLRSDSDLAALQGDPAFGAVIAECERRRFGFQALAQTTRLVAEPAAARMPWPLLLALHGYDGNAAETLASWSPLVARGWLVAALQSAQRSGMDRTDEAQAQRDVQHHLRELAGVFRLEPARLAVGGVSNGGRTALMLALTGGIPARQAISVGGSLRDETLVALDWPAVHRAEAPRLLLIVGAQDQPVLARLTQQAAILADHGVDVVLQIVPGLDHRIPADLADRLLSWLT